MKLLFDDGQIALYHGDGRHPPASAGDAVAVITDPPYGDTSLRWDQWCDGWIAALPDPIAQLWCFGSMRMFLDHAGEFAGWKFAQDLILEKHNGSGLHNDRFRRVHECACHFYRGDWKSLHITPPIVTIIEERRRSRLLRTSKPAHFGEVGRGAGYAYDGQRLMRSVLYSKSSHSQAVHPTQKPEEILRPLIEYSVPPGGLVFDPFAGSGSTLIACRQLNRRAIGIEMDHEACAAALQRLQQIELISLP